MQGFTATIENVRTVTDSRCGAEAARRKIHATLDPVWDRLTCGDWSLLPAKELRSLAPQLRTAYARVFDTTVLDLLYVRGQEFMPAYSAPAWMGTQASEAIARALSLDVAAAIGTHRLIRWLHDTRPHGLTEKGNGPLDDPGLDVAIWHCLTTSLGPAGGAAARMLSATVREYLLHAHGGSEDTAAAIGDLLQSYQCTFPIAAHHGDPRKLVMLCA